MDFEVIEVKKVTILFVDIYSTPVRLRNFNLVIRHPAGEEVNAIDFQVAILDF